MPKGERGKYKRIREPESSDSEVDVTENLMTHGHMPLDNARVSDTVDDIIHPKIGLPQSICENDFRYIFYFIILF